MRHLRLLSVLALLLLEQQCAHAASSDQGMAGNGETRANGDPILPVDLVDCADVPVGVSQLDLASEADLVVTGITLAAGPGAGYCEANGTLNIALDNSTEPSTNFIVLGIQCVHKGLLSCRSNAEDTKDCLILVAAPNSNSSAPCALAQGERYMFFLQNNTNGCGGYYLTKFLHVYHSARRPLGGTGCTFYPQYPNPTDLEDSLASTCTTPVSCTENACDPKITKSPCANDTNVQCTMKQCGGKFMYFNAILPEDTCFDIYSYATSGIPTNCYGRRYINNRIAQLAAQSGLNTSGDANLTMPSPGTSPAVNPSTNIKSSSNKTTKSTPNEGGAGKTASGKTGADPGGQVKAAGKSNTSADISNASKKISSSSSDSAPDAKNASKNSGLTGMLKGLLGK